MKAIYRFDANQVFLGSNIVEDNYTLKPNETFVKPTDGLYEPIKWNGTAWVGTSKEDYEKAHPTSTDVEEPTDQQKFNATTDVKVAQLMAYSEQQNQLNASLTVDVAMLKKQLGQLTKPAGTANNAQ